MSIKQIIDAVNQYWEDEFNETQLLSETDDLSNVGLAYSTDGNGEHEIQWTLNIPKLQVTCAIDDVVRATINYPSIEELTEEVAGMLDFDWLITEGERLVYCGNI